MTFTHYKRASVITISIEDINSCNYKIFFFNYILINKILSNIWNIIIYHFPYFQGCYFTVEMSHFATKQKEEKKSKLKY